MGCRDEPFEKRKEKIDKETGENFCRDSKGTDNTLKPKCKRGSLA